MANRSQDSSGLVEALGHVRDPDLRETLSDLGLIAVTSSRHGKSAVQISFIPGDDWVEENIREQVYRALEGFEGVSVSYLPLDDTGQRELGARVLDEAEQEAAVSRTPRFSAAQSRTRVIAIASGKGGVGKSSVTAHLAMELARRGRRVAVCDADVYGFSIPSIIGVTRNPRVLGQFILPPRRFEVAVMSLGYFVDEDTPVIWRGPMLHKTIEQFLVDVHWGELDYLLVDTPPGTGDVTLSLAEFLPRAEVLVVTTPQISAHRVAQRSAFAARKLRLPVRGVIENMAGFVTPEGAHIALFGEGGGDVLAKSLDVGVLARIPISMAVREAGDAGQPLEDEVAGAAFAQLATALEEMGPTRRYHQELKVRSHSEE